MESVEVKALKEQINKNEFNLQKMINDIDKIWEDTGLDPKESAYLIEKTMRFEIAQKNVSSMIKVFKEIMENYKKLCQELEKSDSV